MIHKERVFILKVFKHSESDLIVHALNSSGARMNFFARGALKSRKRFAGGILEPTHYLEVSYKEGSSNDGDPLHSLLEAQLIREFVKLRTDYQRLETALYFLKVVHKLSQPGMVDAQDLFNLLGNALAAAEVSNDLAKLKLHFELKLLLTQGSLPSSDDLHPWLNTILGQHEMINIADSERRFLESRVHSHLQQYLGQI